MARPEVTLRFDRLPDGTLVAVHTHDHRSVAAIVHPRRILHPMDPVPPIHWDLAGDVANRVRPSGAAPRSSTACAEAAQALGNVLGVAVVGFEVADQ